MSVLAAGLLVAPQPALAAAGDQVECYNGSYGQPGYSIRCFLETNAGQSQQAWKINGNSYGLGAGDYFITFSCQKNFSYTVQVNYLDGNSVPSQVSTSDTCGAMNP